MIRRGGRVFRAPAAGRVRIDLFVYGTLLSPALRTELVGSPLESEPARLDGYLRTRLHGEEYPGLAPRAGASTEGLVLRGVGRDALRRFDAYEGPLYLRCPVLPRLLRDPSMRRSAQTYLLKPGQIQRLSNEPWEPAQGR